MNKRQHKSGLGVRPQSGEVKIKKRALGGRRVWVIIKRGVAKGLQIKNGNATSGELGPGSYEGEYAPHPNNPKLNSIKVLTDPKHTDNSTYLIPDTLPQQNVEFEIEDSDSTDSKHG